MKIYTKIEEIKALVAQRRAEGESVGLVPTMGALHAGHASLIKRSLSENALTVVSVFVNPTQFNDKNDLTNYPRDLEADARLIATLEEEATTTHINSEENDANSRDKVAVFAPTVDEVYPEPDTRTFSYPPTDTVMEGARRPGHFNGVCQIVSKLFMMVNPDKAYFGEKDFQQIAVIRAMMADQGFDFELVACPIVREESGLALSSRNMLISDSERMTAVNISKTLFESVAFAADHTIRATHDFVVDTLNRIEGLEVEYFEIVNGLTLEKISDWSEAETVQGCITVYCGERPVRLIDNIKYK